MLRSFTKTQALCAQVASATKQVPRFSSALLHTQPLYESDSDAPITALGARLGLQSLDTQILKQALTHKSVDNAPNNASLEFIGKRVVGLYATEFVHVKYPSLHPGAFNTTMRAFIGNKSFYKIASEVGLQHSIQWKASDDIKLGQNTVMADCFNAIVGAIYQEQGQEAAKKFIHNFVLARDFNIKPAIKVQEPKRHLTALLKQLGKEGAESRLLSETGRASSAPVFVVGVFSGKEKLGEGFGSSLKMAEFRACEDALTSYYGQEQKDYVLPSDAENVDKYVANPLGNTQAII